MKKIARWLEEHAMVWPWQGKESVAHLWALILTPILMFVAFFTFKDITIPFQVIFGGVAVAPPIIAGIIALVKREKWNPWFWFPLVVGAVLGGIFACLIFWAFF